MIVDMNLPLSGALFLLPLHLQSGLGESAVVAGVVLLGLGGATFPAAALIPLATFRGRTGPGPA
jgi:hypothetical protein